MGRPTTLPEPWRSLAAELERRWLADAGHDGQSCPGGVTLAAEALRCSPVTLRRWAAGTQPPDPRAQAWIQSVFRDCGLEPPEA